MDMLLGVRIWCCSQETILHRYGIDICIRQLTLRQYPECLLIQNSEGNGGQGFIIRVIVSMNSLVKSFKLNVISTERITWVSYHSNINCTRSKSKIPSQYIHNASIIQNSTINLSSTELPCGLSDATKVIETQYVLSRVVQIVPNQNVLTLQKY